MKYEDALKIWGAKLVARQNMHDILFEKIDLDTVQVELDLEEGYACCGGSDPSCYCSFAESPSAHVLVSCKGVGIGKRRTSTYQAVMDSDRFDFATVLKELCEIGDGNISS